MSDGTTSDYFTFIMGYDRDVFFPNTLQHLHGTCTGEDVGEIGCDVSFGTVYTTDMDFTDDAVIIAETTEVVSGALDSLSEFPG